MNGMTWRRRQAEKAGREQSRKMNRRRTRPVLEALALPEDVTGGAVRLIVMGCGRVLAENHRGIVEVTPTRVRLMTGDGVLAVSGENLYLRDVRTGALCISGSIAAIELPAGGRP